MAFFLGDEWVTKIYSVPPPAPRLLASIITAIGFRTVIPYLAGFCRIGRFSLLSRCRTRKTPTRFCLYVNLELSQTGTFGVTSPTTGRNGCVPFTVFYVVDEHSFRTLT